MLVCLLSEASCSLSVLSLFQKSFISCHQWVEGISSCWLSSNRIENTLINLLVVSLIISSIVNGSRPVMSVTCSLLGHISTCESSLHTTCNFYWVTVRLSLIGVISIVISLWSDWSQTLLSSWVVMTLTPVLSIRRYSFEREALMCNSRLSNYCRFKGVIITLLHWLLFCILVSLSIRESVITSRTHSSHLVVKVLHWRYSCLKISWIELLCLQALHWLNFLYVFISVGLFISCIICLVIISSRISLVKLKFRRVLLLSQLRQRSLPIDIAIKFRLLFLSQVVVEVSCAVWMSILSLLIVIKLLLFHCIISLLFKHDITPN